MIHDEIPIPELTSQEQKVLDCLVEGLSNHEIATQMFISPSTAKWYIRQLNAKLGTKNRKEIVTRARAIGLLEPDGHIADVQPVSPTLVPNNLPSDLTPFIGRTSELNQLRETLQDDHVRLLTIAGSGGMGKTRTALTLARQQLQRYPDGVYFVSLVGKNSIEMTASSILLAMGVRAPMAVTPQEHVLMILHDQRSLLVLDNFEHMLEVTPFITDILQLCPHVHIIITSRVRLNLSFERVFFLGGLPYGDNPVAEALLTERVRAVAPHLLETEADQITRICALTEGMPLALVLAASWTDTLSLIELATEIERNIDILASDQRDIPSRQRSIRATLDYSWQRLSEAERDVATQLSIFQGGFQREAAIAVANATIPILRSLVQRSFLTLQDGRYRMHEIIRQYAGEYLQRDDTEYHEAQETHADYFADYLSTILEGSFTEADLPFADLVMMEQPNILSAWDRIILDQDHMIATRAIRAMSIAYQNQLTWHETYQLMTETVSLLKPMMQDPFQAYKMAGALATLAWAAAWTGHYSEAHEHVELSEEINEALYEEDLIPMRDQNMPVASAFAHTEIGEYEAAIPHAQLGLERSVSQPVKGMGTHVMVAARMLGELYLIKGDLVQAKQYLQQGIDAVADLEGFWVRWWEAKSHVELAKVAYLQGNMEAMEQHFDAYATCEDAANDLDLRARVAYYRGQIALDQEDFEAAQVYMEESVAWFERTGYRRYLHTALADSVYSQIAVSEYHDARQDLLYILDYSADNPRVMIPTMLSSAYLFIRIRAVLDIAKGFLQWVSAHPASTEFMTYQRATKLLKQHHSLLAEAEADTVDAITLPIIKDKIYPVLENLSFSPAS